MVLLIIRKAKLLGIKASANIIEADFDSIYVWLRVFKWVPVSYI